MEFDRILLILGAGLVAGFLNTVAGGGSLLTLPMLIFLGLPSAVANGTNRLAILFQTISATLTYKSGGVSDFPYSAFITAPALLGAWIGASIAIDLDDRIFNRILAVVMLLVLIHIAWPKKNRPLHEAGRSARLQVKERLLSLITFFFLGIYGGFIQAGIGFLILAALTWIKGYDLVKANAIKVFVVLCYTLVALVAFIAASKIHWQIGLTLAVGNSTGAWVGGRFAVLKGSNAVRWVLVGSILVFAIRLFFN
jgi:uncharacterized membrane protein YfcA